MTERSFAEDIVVGVPVDLGWATLTETEIIAFARDWDPQDLHVDPASSAAGRYEGVIASGVQTIGVFMRLAARQVYGGWALVAGRAIRNAVFHRPVRADVRMTGTLVVESVTAYSPERANVAHRGALRDHSGTLLTIDLEAVVLRRLSAEERP